MSRFNEIDRPMSLSEQIGNLDMKEVLSLSKALETRQKEIETDIHLELQHFFYDQEDEYRDKVISSSWVTDREELQKYTDRSCHLPIYRIDLKHPEWDVPAAYFLTKKGSVLFHSSIDWV